MTFHTSSPFVTVRTPSEKTKPPMTSVGAMLLEKLPEFDCSALTGSDLRSDIVGWAYEPRQELTFVSSAIKITSVYDSLTRG